MVEISKKEILKRFLVLISIYLGFVFAYPILNPIFKSATLNLNQKIANSFNVDDGFNGKHIVFEIQDDELIAYIKNPVKKRGLAADTSFIRLDVRTHIYMPFVIMISILSVLRLKNKNILIFFLSFFSILLFIQFKIWIYILDQSNHFLVITDSGEYVSHLKDGFFISFYNILNKIFNIKGALFIRYIYPVATISILYLIFNYNDKKIIFSNSKKI